MLYDWERCTLGAAAIDLAITMPGLGNRSAFEEVVTVYCSFAPGIDPNRLATDIACAKAWSVVEFLAHYADGAVSPTFPIEPLLEDIPDWLRDIGRPR